MPIIYGVICIELIILTLQLWLLTATMNAFLGGDESIILPAALASLCCFFLNYWLLGYIYKIEKKLD